MTNEHEMAADFREMLQMAFERSKLKGWKIKVLTHLKYDPDALLLIQDVARTNIDECDGIKKEFYQWILDGCKPWYDINEQ